MGREKKNEKQGDFMTTDKILSVENVTMKFGGLTAVNEISLDIFSNDLVAIIGPNGAGKTTLFNVITGIYRPTIGKVIFNHNELKKLKTSAITRLGIARTFQNIRLFKDLSVLDNIRLGKHTRIKYSFLDGILQLPAFKQEEQRIESECDELLKLFKLDHKKYLLAKNLSYGEQRKLEMIRAIATQPKLLLLDEPAAGMNPTETKDLMDLIRLIRDQFQIAIVLIEHDMKLVMGLAEKIFVLNYGNLIASGTPLEIRNNKKVIEAYLGIDEDLETKASSI